MQNPSSLPNTSYSKYHSKKYQNLTKTSKWRIFMIPNQFIEAQPTNALSWFTHWSPNIHIQPLHSTFNLYYEKSIEMFLITKQYKLIFEIDWLSSFTLKCENLLAISHSFTDVITSPHLILCFSFSEWEIFSLFWIHFISFCGKWEILCVIEENERKEGKFHVLVKKYFIFVPGWQSEIWGM